MCNRVLPRLKEGVDVDFIIEGAVHRKFLLVKYPVSVNESLCLSALFVSSAYIYI